jgi:hypothetical protein
VDKNGKNEKRYGIKWTISFSFDQHFSANSVLSHTKEINLIFDAKPLSIDANSLQPQKQLLHAYELVKPLFPAVEDVDPFAHHLHLEHRDSQNAHKNTATFGKGEAIPFS